MGRHGLRAIANARIRAPAARDFDLIPVIPSRSISVSLDCSH
jgi:hypothetical protein